MNKKTLQISAGIIFVIGGIVTAIFFQRLNNKEPYELVAVQKGTIVQEISASGKVESPTKVNLRFKNSGMLVVLNAMVGKKFSAGQLLAKQDTTELDTRVAEIQADIDLQKAKLDQLLRATSPEDINIVETAVSNAEIAITNAKQTLEDAKRNLIVEIKDAYTKSDDAVRVKADQLFNNPKSSSPQLSFSYPDTQLETDVEWERLLIESTLNAWLESLNTISTKNDLSFATALVDKNTDQINSFLNKIATIISAISPNTNLSKITITKWENDVSTARKNLNVAISNISDAKKNINTKEAGLKTAEGNLKTAQNKLVLKRAPARPQDIAVYEAKISRDQASIQKTQAQIQDRIIVAHSSGIVTKISGEVGKVIGPNVTVISLVPSGVLQVNLNVLVDDMANIKLGQEARITLDALEGKEFGGKVVTIDRTETIIGGKAHYKTTVLFDKEDEQIKHGMIANIRIKTASSENTLFVPVNAIQKKDGKKIVQVLEMNQVVEKEVTTGLQNDGGMIEITSGLLGGEQVILAKK